MKKIVIGLVVFLILIVGSGMVVGSTNFNLYSDQEHVSSTEIFDGDKPTVYYYYSPSCHFCTNVKGEVTKFAKAVDAKEGIDLKLIDTTANPKLVTDPAPFVDPENQIKTPEDLTISGTPTMIYVKDNKVVEYEVGVDIFKVMDVVNEEFDLNLTLDPDKING